MGKKILHIAPKERINNILEDGFLDNTHHKQWDIYGKVNGKLFEVKGFVYDLLKIKRSQYTRNAPRVDNQFIVKKRAGTYMKIFPKYVDVYKVDLFQALIFETNIHKKNVLENYMIDLENNSEIYYETAFLKKAKVMNPQIISGEDAANILGLEKPFLTYKYEDDGYQGRRLESNPKTIINPNYRKK